MFKREDALVGIVSVLLGIFALVTASTFNENTALDVMGPGGVPKILAWVILIIGIVHLVGAYYAPKLDEDKKAQRIKRFEEIKPVLRIALVCVLYIFLLEYIGYLIATPLLMIGIMWTINVRDIKSLLLTSIITTTVLFLIFGVALKVKLPMGFFSNIF
jgi:bacteriorhodopsin